MPQARLRRTHPVTRHDPTRSEKREHAFELFERGYTNADVVRVVGINKNTATTYRRMYEDDLQNKVDEDPGFLRDVVGNTFRQLSELEQIRKAAWRDYELSLTAIPVFCTHCLAMVEECPHCGDELAVIVGSPKDRQSNLSIALKAQQERSKLFGVAGIKAEFFAMVSQVKAVQDLILEFLARELCAQDRAKLDEFMDSPEMAKYLGAEIPITVESMELPA